MGIVAVCGFGLALLLSAWTRDLVMLLVPSQLANSSNDYGQIASFRSFEINGVVGIGAALLGLATMAAASVLATRPSLRMDLTVDVEERRRPHPPAAALARANGCCSSCRSPRR